MIGFPTPVPRRDASLRVDAPERVSGVPSRRLPLLCVMGREIGVLAVLVRRVISGVRRYSLQRGDRPYQHGQNGSTTTWQ